MIAISSRFNDTTTTTSCSDNSTMTVTYINSYKDNWEYEPDYLEDEREMVRSGWYNPRKIPIKNHLAYKYIKLQIRNQLPYKIRAMDNVL